MKINIFYPAKEGPWGGGNQFLKALQMELAKQGFCETDVSKADAILFNSHHQLGEVLELRRKYPNKIFIHRIDGPLFLTRKNWRSRVLDKLIFWFSEKIADASVFQSEWSREASRRWGYKQKQFDTVIYNAPDVGIFNVNNKMIHQHQPVRLVADSWSANWQKGFDVYKYLDENLDFNKFNFTFIGNSPVPFKNIKMIPPLGSVDLATELKKHDIFIAASQNDPCSNSLIEALSCGLPAIVRRSGGHSELIRNGGLVFERLEEIDKLLEKMVVDYQTYVSKVPKFDLQEATMKYVELCRGLMAGGVVDRKDIPNRVIVRIIIFFLKWLV